MAGTTEGGKKAAQTRGRESLSQAGRKGGLNSHKNSTKNAGSQKQMSNQADRRSNDDE